MIDIWTPADPWPGETRELLIVGPPGTGKTRNVLDAYVWPALREGQTILATSYTRAAAEELRKRTGEHFEKPPGTYREELSTMHSEASRRCRALQFKLGIEPSGGGPTPDEDDTDRHEVEIAARIDEESTRSGIAAWDRTRNLYPEDIGLPIEDRLRRVGLYGAQLDDAVVAVERDMHARYRDGVLVTPDFTSLLEQALVRGDERRLDLLVADEVQDLTPLQWSLFDRWARMATRVLLVGDPDQSIYAWAGADGHRLLSWIRAGRCTRRLAQSYRVPVAAHRLARQVISLVTDREDAPYHPKVDRDTGIPVEGTVTEAYGEDAWEAVAAAQDAGESVFVLARTRGGCATAIEEMERIGIPYIGERGGSVLGQPAAPSRALSVALAMQEVANGENVHPEGARRLVAALSTKGLVTLRRGAKGDLTEAVKGKRARVPIDVLAEAGLPVDEIAEVWRVLSGKDPHPDPGREAARCLIASVVSADDVTRVARWVALYGDDMMPMAARVRVTTAHGSKGREAAVVVLDARSRIRGRQAQAEADEDRRVLYVAVTRTERDLILLRSYGSEDWLSMHGVSVR